MHELFACSTFAVAVSLSVARPRIGPHFRFGPATAAVLGALLLLASGTIRLPDLASAAAMMWRPLITILAIMITTAVAARAGAIDSLAGRLFARSSGEARRLFGSVFAVSFLTASVLNNDAAVLLLTPLVLALIRRRYPAHPQLLMPFAFAVFMAAGVAPFVVSNPVNVVVASHARLNFNGYALVMVPVALTCSAITFLLLRAFFAKELGTSATAVVDEAPPVRTALQRQITLLLVAVLGSYPLVAMLDNSAIWAVAVIGSVTALLLAAYGNIDIWRVLRQGVSWEVLIFLPAMLVLALGLRNVGLVDWLASWYADADVARIGGTAALGSALLNNHPMALINALALEARPGAGQREFLAALIGGDLGPRLLPIGSLAGLIWLESCRRLGVHIALRQFVRIGAAVTVPALIASLALLARL